jgi:feruloyl esterase
MPAAGWNSRFAGVGNGGFAGAIDFRAMNTNVKRGYATAATDTGHEADSTDATWAYRHPEKIKDFGYRAIHMTAQNAKQIIAKFYERPPQHSYFDSCSDGGREALMEAQRFPEDYDGILAGAPANYWTHLLGSGVGAVQMLAGNPEAYISKLKTPAITAAVLAQCDAADGVKDGFVNNPEVCHFNPSVLLCKGAQTRNCLTPPQVKALERIYAGAKAPSTETAHPAATMTESPLGQDANLSFPGLVPGSEDGDGAWGTWLLGASPGDGLIPQFVNNFFRFMVYNDPAWNVLTAKPDVAIKDADARMAGDLNATDPDLGKFASRGGKLILYHGWYDAAISPWNTIHYYKSVQAKAGEQNALRFVRLYMAPGVGHCFGGPGPSVFGQLGSRTAKGPERGIYAALEEWVESNKAPSEVIATKYAGGKLDGQAEMTRPLCAYPAVAKYKGSGSTNDSANFICSLP